MEELLSHTASVRQSSYFRNTSPATILTSETSSINSEQLAITQAVRKQAHHMSCSQVCYQQ
eukprot:gene8336-876_t